MGCRQKCCWMDGVSRTVVQALSMVIMAISSLMMCEGPKYPASVRPLRGLAEQRKTIVRVGINLVMDRESLDLGGCSGNFGGIYPWMNG